MTKGGASFINAFKPVALAYEKQTRNIGNYGRLGPR